MTGLLKQWDESPCFPTRASPLVGKVSRTHACLNETGLRARSARAPRQQLQGPTANGSAASDGPAVAAAAHRVWAKPLRSDVATIAVACAEAWCPTAVPHRAPGAPRSAIRSAPTSIARDKAWR